MVLFAIHLKDLVPLFQQGPRDVNRKVSLATEVCGPVYTGFTRHTHTHTQDWYKRVYNWNIFPKDSTRTRYAVKLRLSVTLSSVCIIVNIILILNCIDIMWCYFNTSEIILSRIRYHLLFMRQYYTVWRYSAVRMHL